MTGPSFRIATAEDSEFAYETKRVAFGEHVEAVWGWDEEEQRRLHEQRFVSQDFRVITIGGEDAGVLALRVEPDCLKLRQLFLRPEHQGRGIGGWCVARVLEEARERALPVRLRVLKVNVRALAFFDRFGFSRTGETDTHILMQGTT